MKQYNSLPDSDLVLLLLSEDQAAYTEIYKRYHATLYIHIFNKLRNREESRDIVHNLFSKLWEKRTELNLTTSLSSYLFTAVRYQVFDFISRQYIQSAYIKSIKKFAEQYDYETDFMLRENQLKSLIELEIAALPPKMREIFELSRKKFLTHKDIAEKLNISEKTVKKQVNNSLKILRAKLGSGIFNIFFL